MTESHRTVAAEHDLPRVREWLDRAVRESVKNAAEAVRIIENIRYWCDRTEGDVETHKAAEPVFCRGLEMAVKQVRNLLPDLPAVPERRAEPAGGGGDMEQQGTRVTRDRDLAIGGEDGDQAAVRGDDDDRDL